MRSSCPTEAVDPLTTWTSSTRPSTGARETAPAQTLVTAAATGSGAPRRAARRARTVVACSAESAVKRPGSGGTSAARGRSDDRSAPLGAARGADRSEESAVKRPGSGGTAIASTLAKRERPVTSTGRALVLLLSSTFVDQGPLRP